MDDPQVALPGFIDSSMLSTWRACRRKYFWAHINALYPSGKSVHLIAGGAFAAGMEAARRLVFSRARDHQPTFDDILEAAFKAFIREWGDYVPPEKSPKSFYNTFQALAEYLLQYPPETDCIQPLKRPNGEPTVEFTFAIPLDEAPKHPETGDPFLFQGRFDLLGTYNGELNVICDEKTTSAIGFAWGDQWRLRGQFMGYCWACQQLGYPVNTAAIRGIGILKNEYKFATALEQFPQHLIERWYKQLLDDVDSIVVAWRHRQHEAISWPYNFADSCSAYGGCAFVPLCAAKQPESFFSNYIRYRWNPLAKQPVSEVEIAA